MWKNIRRNPNRVRKVQGRKRVKAFSSMTPEGAKKRGPEYEALYAKLKGWD
jgi:hypothetical protein|tara:strand:- start:1794 stop:1946 length:153 start_codon:yes stop_codon:yes gene_type:complete